MTTDRTPETVGREIGNAMARDVAAERMPREWTGLDPQDYDRIPDTFNASDVERVIASAREAFTRAVGQPVD